MGVARVGPSATDVAILAQNASEEVRAGTAAKVAEAFAAGLNGPQRSLAEDIFRALLHDAAAPVRLALAEGVKASAEAPHDVLLALAEDIAEVAIPVLRRSEVLTAADLAAIVGRQGTAHRVAVAQRRAVPERLADALVETRDETAVATLVGNPGADLSEPTLQRVLDYFAESEAVKSPMVRRRTLPPSVSARLVTLVSHQLRRHLIVHHALPVDLVADLVLEGREQARRGAADAADADAAELVRQLARHHRLTVGLVLRAVGLGDVLFFELALARLCDIPVANAHALVGDLGPRGLQAACRRAGIPGGMTGFIAAAVEVARNADGHGVRHARARFKAGMIEVLSRFEADLQVEEVDYLRDRLGATLGR